MDGDAAKRNGGQAWVESVNVDIGVGCGEEKGDVKESERRSEWKSRTDE